jgi:hypothetical protein
MFLVLLGTGVVAVNKKRSLVLQWMGLKSGVKGSETSERDMYCILKVFVESPKI